jgi:DNA-binding SARP family transcriptional activator
MPLETLVNDIYGAFQRYTAEARVALLHASSRYRVALVSRLLSDPSLNVFYYAMGSDDVDVRSWMAGFTHDLAEQIPTFGARINQIIIEDGDDLTPLLRAFVDDLSDLSDKPFLLLLDEFDRADIADDLEQFFEMLVDVLPPQCRLVISSRGLPRMPWMSLIAQRKAIMLRDDELIRENFYENQAQYNDARIQVSGLGPGSVYLDGRAIDTWEGHLPRLLFFFALDRPVVTRSEICQAFWPELNNDQAVNVFHVTKRRLHKALDPLGVDVLIHDGGYYRINPDLSIHYDVMDFASALVAGRVTEDKKQTQAWQRAIDMHQRPFLQGHTETWILKRRREYQAGYVEALSEMANIRLHEGRPEHALTLLLRAVNEDMTRQDLHRQVMSLYADLGRRSEAASHYQKIQDQLRDKNISLESETAELYIELMS